MAQRPVKTVTLTMPRTKYTISHFKPKVKQRLAQPGSAQSQPSLGICKPAPLCVVDVFTERQQKQAHKQHQLAIATPATTSLQRELEAVGGEAEEPRLAQSKRNAKASQGGFSIKRKEAVLSGSGYFRMRIRVMLNEGHGRLRAVKFIMRHVACRNTLAQCTKKRVEESRANSNSSHKNAGNSVRKNYVSAKQLRPKGVEVWMHEVKTNGRNQ